jgi:hypothetical protein
LAPALLASWQRNNYTTTDTTLWCWTKAKALADDWLHAELAMQHSIMARNFSPFVNQNLNITFSNGFRLA